MRWSDRRCWPVLAAALLALACAAGGEPMTARSLAACPKRPNCVSSQATDAGHHVDPFVLRVPPERGFAALRAAIAALPRTRIVVDEAGYLHAEVTSRLFRFVDDVEALLDPGGARIDVRSASRVGYSDLGVNRARVEVLRGALRRDGAVD
jgi:uncharacterized protein (DUF1499 family)